MIKKLKKGFTLIELVVVIAVVAILAAVSVVTYVTITNKAHQSANEQLVTQFNNTIKGDPAIKAPHDALGLLETKGTKLANLEPEQPEKYEFAYHSVAKRVIILDDDASEILYPEDLKKSELTAADKVAIFRFAHVDADISTYSEAGFSAYLSDNTPGDETHFSASLTVNKGLDVGDEEITTLSYDNSAASGAQDVILRTNLVSDDKEVINLSVNAYVNGDDCDHIVHFGKSGKVNVIQSGAHSLVTHGYVAVANIFSGRIYPSNGGRVDLAIAMTVNAIVGREEGTGTYGLTIAGSAEIKDGHIGSDKALLSFPDGVTASSSPEDFAAAIAQMINEVYEEIFPTPVPDDPYANAPRDAKYALVDNEGGIYYQNHGLEEALAGLNNYTLVLLDDVDLPFFYQTNVTYTFDLHGHTMDLSHESDGFGCTKSNVTIMDSDPENNGTLICCALECMYDSSMIIESGNIRFTDGPSTPWGGMMADFGLGGPITMNGGTVNADPTGHVGAGHVASESDGIWTII